MGKFYISSTVANTISWKETTATLELVQTYSQPIREVLLTNVQDIPARLDKRRIQRLILTGKRHEMTQL